MTNTKEQTVVWKQYPDYPFIEANQFGEIRTLDHYTEGKDGKRYLVKGHVLKQFDNGTGYLQVSPYVNGKQVNLYVHRIVATCFLPNPDNLPEVNHKDNNPKNNFANNLEFCTREYNIAYREKYGTACNRPVFAVNLKTSEVLHFESQSEAARQLGVYQNNICAILKGRRKKTHEYWFCYADEDAIEKVRAKFGNEVADEVEKLMNEDHN